MRKCKDCSKCKNIDLNIGKCDHKKRMIIRDSNACEDFSELDRFEDFLKKEVFKT